jgi:hypothetical protein
MSALWQMLTSVWAAVWLRGRLLAIGVRRRFGSGRGPAVGADYHLTVAETPVEGVDYDPTEIPAALVTGLDAVRAGLLEQARGATAQAPSRRGARRRRRTASSVAVALLTLSILGAGAAAVVVGTTGVPAVDRLLGAFETRSEKPGSPGLPAGGFQASSRASTIEVPAGSQTLVSASYVAIDGRVCSALTDPERQDAFGTATCATRTTLEKQFSSRDGMLLGVVGLSEAVVLRGFVSGRVKSLSGEGPSGPLETRLGEPWKPDGFGGLEVRPFVAIGGPEHDGLANPDDYVLRTLNEDGSSRRISP